MKMNEYKANHSLMCISFKLFYQMNCKWVGIVNRVLLRKPESRSEKRVHSFNYLICYFNTKINKKRKEKQEIAKILGIEYVSKEWRVQWGGIIS